jgi:hypothetical protein
MTDDRSLERAARQWLEDGPTEAPDSAVEAALLRIQTTHQERALPVLWRFPSMNMMSRLIAGSAAVAVVVVAGLFALRPGGGPGVGASPSPSSSPSASPDAERSPSPSAPPPAAACGLVTTAEAAIYGPVGGATTNGSSNGAESTCLYTAGDVVLTLTLTKPGGTAAFNRVKTSAGMQVIGDLGADGVFDPASATLYVSKGDALVAIHIDESLRLSGASAVQTKATQLAAEKTLARTILDRL